jgi:hypothetical protein
MLGIQTMEWKGKKGDEKKEINCGAEQKGEFQEMEKNNRI